MRSVWHEFVSCFYQSKKEDSNLDETQNNLILMMPTSLKGQLTVFSPSFSPRSAYWCSISDPRQRSFHFFIKPTRVRKLLYHLIFSPEDKYSAATPFFFSLSFSPSRTDIPTSFLQNLPPVTPKAKDIAVKYFSLTKGMQ
jgi:hypothetical protein